MLENNDTPQTTVLVLVEEMFSTENTDLDVSDVEGLLDDISQTIAGQHSDALSKNK